MDRVKFERADFLALSAIHAAALAIVFAILLFTMQVSSSYYGRRVIRIYLWNATAVACLTLLVIGVSVGVVFSIVCPADNTLRWLQFAGILYLLFSFVSVFFLFALYVVTARRIDSRNLTTHVCRTAIRGIRAGNPDLLGDAILALTGVLRHQTKSGIDTEVVLGFLTPGGDSTMLGIFREFYKLKREDPSKYQDLYFSKHVMKLYEEDPEAAKWEISIDRERCMPIKRLAELALTLYGAALDNGQDGIERHVAYNLIWLIQECTADRGNELMVEQLLFQLHSFAEIAISHRGISRYPLIAHWYRDVVLPPGRGEGSRLDYLDLLNRNFFYLNQLVVRRNALELWIDEIGYVTASLHTIRPSYWKIVEAAGESSNEALHDLVEQLEVLTRSEPDEQAFAEIESVAELTEKEISTCSDSTKANGALQALSDFMKDVRAQFKQRRIKGWFMVIGAYCVFKKRWRFVKELWEYAQPPDSDASWAGGNLAPANLDVILGHYVAGWEDCQKIHFEERHGSASYLRDYFLMTCARTCLINPSVRFGFSYVVENDRVRSQQLLQIEAVLKDADGLLARTMELENSEGLRAILGDSTLAFTRLRERIAEGKQAIDALIVGEVRELPIDRAKTEMIEQKLFDSYSSHRVAPTVLGVKQYDGDRHSPLEVVEFSDTKELMRRFLTSISGASIIWAIGGSVVADKESSYLMDRICDEARDSAMQLSRIDYSALCDAVTSLKQKGFRPDRVIWPWPSSSIWRRMPASSLNWRGGVAYIKCGEYEMQLIRLTSRIQCSGVIVLDSKTLGTWVDVEPFATIVLEMGSTCVELRSSAKGALVIEDPRAVVMLAESSF